MFRLVEGGEKLPQRATQRSAGFDVFAREDVVIQCGETKLVGLGVCLDIALTIDVIHLNVFMESHYFQLHPRSSIRAKGLGGGVGVIDMDYRDEIKMIITNPSDLQYKYTIKRGDKIGQLILCKHEGYLLPSEYTLDNNRVGGFGSTDE